MAKLRHNRKNNDNDKQKKYKHKNTFVHLYSEVIQDSDQIETNLNYVVEDKDSHKYIKSQTYKHTKHTKILTSWL